MRFIGLDVHRDFCVIAISENGHVRSAGMVATTPEKLAILADSLRPDNQVALEATSNALSIARILEAPRRASGRRDPSRPGGECPRESQDRQARLAHAGEAAGLLAVGTTV